MIDIERCQERANKYATELRKEQSKYDVIKVVHNKEKSTTVVWFKNGEKVIVKRSKGAKDDVYTAVAFAITKRAFTNNSTFQKMVDKALQNKEAIR